MVRRRRGRAPPPAGGDLTTLLLLIGTASAQGLPREPIDVERFKPALTHDAFVVTEGTGVREPFPDDPIALGVMLNGSLNPLVVVAADGDITDRFVSGRVGGDLFASTTLVGPLSIGLGLPFFAAQAGDFGPNAAGIGDLRLLPKVRVVDDRNAPLGVALLAEVRLPTHSDDEFSGGARSPVFAPRVALDHRFRFGLRLGANGGVLLRESTTFENVTAASELTYSAAASIEPPGYRGRWSLGADVHGGAGLQGIDFEELPLEGQLVATVRPRPDLEVLGGPAMGLVPGYGTPTVRAFVGLRFAPTAHDQDYDGIADRDDACPQEPEVRNGIDDDDGCPESRLKRKEPAAPGTVVVRILGPDGEPVKRAEARIDATKGSPGPDPGRVDIEVAPGEHVLWVRAKGYVPQRIEIEIAPGETVDKTVTMQPIEIEVTSDRLELSGSVYFDTGSARLVDESHDLLDEVALVLIENPSIKLMHVEGHTDARGSEEFNQELSEARAASVVAYLVKQGVDPGRLEPHGYGETRPISENYDENRRVEFVIVRGSVEGVEAPAPEPAPEPPAPE